MATEDIDYSSKHIVVFEDNPVWQKTIKLWLKHYGCDKIHVFGKQDEIVDYVKDNHEDIDLCLVDFYDLEGDTTGVIRKLRCMSADLLIIAISADFINDNAVLDTVEMVKAINAGANRVTLKDIKQLKEIANEHFAVRGHENYNEIKTDPNAFINKL
jgi:CheY-like chemotaxis protein